jgi:hypothetical protein
MLERVIAVVSIVASAFVLLGFGLFAYDEVSEASRRVTQEISPSPERERARERSHSTLREVIDDVNDVLLAPFADVADGSGDAWVRRGVPALLGLLLYAIVLGFVARWTRGRAGPVPQPRYG